ncbi:DoxX-like family protein [Urechidicola croceus]|uniref:DoxX family protein n=1 Tax=Urechidicola croceus TaxID=1850246 RepID=A0A1D8P7I9_9FLAO|nr:DoxX-like family protein [Urechidicola croceus]AOW20543.1 hypothetical protein LPB138_07565 [Urechidicola croceus]
MNTKKLLNITIATVWLINGLYCKILNFVPRHQEIVAIILGQENSGVFTTIIGLLEIGMTIWILIGYKSQLNAITQISIIALMNILEFILVPDLLLWGKLNSVFTFLFITFIYFNEFIINKKNDHVI